MKKLIWLLLVLVLLTGCSGNKIKVNKDILEESLNEVMNEAKEEKGAEFLVLLEEKISCKLLSFEEIEDGSVEGKVQVKAPDFYSILKEFEQMPFTSEEDINALMMEKVEQADMVEKEVTLTFVYEEESGWKPLLTDTFVDAYYGGFLTYRSEYLNSLEVE